MGMFDFVGDIASTIGSALSSENSLRQQKSALQHSIQWRVQDARKAGIHPIYALGGPTMSVNPQPVDFSGLANAGQNIVRARQAAMDRKERAGTQIQTATEAAAAKLGLQNMSLQNDLLASQIARLNSNQVPPPFPSMGAMGGSVGGSDRVQPIPAMPTINAPGNNAREAGVVTDYGYSSNDSGGLSVTPSMDVKNRIEDNMLQEFAWAFRNQLLPSIGGLRPPSTREFPLPAGQRWRWDPYSQQFLPYSDRTGNWYPRGRVQRDTFPRMRN